MNRRTNRRWGGLILAVILGAGILVPATVTVTATAASAADYVPVNGAGSTWSANAIDQWRRNVQQYGMKINYASSGSSDGRNQFKSGTVDFAVSEIPYGLTDAGVVDTPPSRGYAYMPVVAGGTAFMYNLQIGGKRVTNLRLSGPVLAKIFTGAITKWNHKDIAADNPSLSLPNRAIVPVVRSDGSGSTAQFTAWMASEQSSTWNAYCTQAGRSGKCGQTSNFPIVDGKGFVGQAGSQGVAGYVAQTANIGTITYVEYSYALKSGYPVAKVLNRSGYYVEPTASNVAVGLLGAKINTDKGSDQYLTQKLKGVYRNSDARTYPLSSYSYLIIPTSTQSGFTQSKGETLGAFSYYFLCEGQQQADALGYSPLPINLVKAGLAQVKRIPGVKTQSIDIKKCNNPTFSSDGTNTLATQAPMPDACDKKGADEQCAQGTGGATGTTNPGSSGGSTGGSGSGSGGGPGSGDDSAAGGEPGALDSAGEPAA
ncbi:phosphate ABC transporter substrate-binding protein PstS [Leucobacter soli]|uniref:phosphate ABC transporter substrate-binding protein PstS n=1 Tax=Leucobacter soli TaxID=2812850 RepID=UPI003609CD14